jgi:integrase
VADRRGSGEGSVYQETSGLWAASLWVDGPNGRTRKVMRSKDKAVVVAKLAKAIADRADGLPPVSQTLTVGSWLEWWLANVLPGTVKAKSETAYASRTRCLIVPHLGKIALAKLSAEDVQEWLRKLERQGLAPRTQRLAKMTLGKALKDAMRYGKLHKDVSAMVKPPKCPTTKLDDSLSAREAEAILLAARGDRLEALAVIFLTLGLRQMEGFRLRWSDVNLKLGTLSVGEAKSRSGQRTLELPDFLVGAISAHRVAQDLERAASPVWSDAGLMFPDELGQPYGPNRALRWWHRLTVAAGLGKRRQHASRHTAATLMLERQVPLEVISKLLGHASYAITADLYAQVRPQAMRSAVESLSDLYR